MLELIHNNKDHSNIEQLLPWYVNGTLSESEHHMVEEHVFNCESCQKEIKFLNSSFDVLNHDDTLISHSEKRFDRLMERIDDSQNSDTVAANIRNSEHQKNWFSKPVYAIAASFIAALLVFYWYLPTGSDTLNTFETLTADNPAGLQLQVIFKADTSSQDTLAILDQIDNELTISDNHPVYTVSLSPDYDAIKVAELINALNAQPTITEAGIVSDEN